MEKLRKIEVSDGKKKRNKARTAIFLAFLIVGLAVFSVVLLSNNSSVDEAQTLSQTQEMIKDRAFINQLRQKDVLDERNGDYLFSYDANQKEVTVRSADNSLDLQMKLDSPYNVVGLAAGPDTKVAEFYLEDWNSKKSSLFDTISLHNAKKDYSEFNREVWFKYGVDFEECSSDGCMDHTRWVRFDSLDELPHKGVKISMWTNTEPHESVEWVPTINGIQVLQWAVWNVSGATKVGELDVSGQNTVPKSVYFNGTKMYVAGDNPDGVFEYNCTTAWNASTCSYSTTINIGTGPALFFRDDGTSMYTCAAGNIVTQSDLTSPWHVNTASAVETFSMAGLDDCRGFSFSQDGKFFYSADSTDSLGMWVATDAWNLSAATANGTVATPWQTETQGGVIIKGDGTQIMMSGSDKDTVSEVNLTGAYDVNTAVHFGNLSLGIATPRGSFIHPTHGKWIYVVDDTNNKILQYSLPNENPSVTLDEPANNTQSIYKTVDLNCTATDDNQVVNVSLYINGIRNITKTGSTTSERLNATLTFAEGKYNWTCLTYDDDDGSTWATNYTFTVSNFTENSQTFSSSVIERSLQMFSINISYDTSEFTNAQATLNYNNTDYVGTSQTIGSDVIFNRSITVPDISSKTNFTFYWKIELTDGGTSKHNSTFQNQTVTVLTLDDCSSNSIGLFNFTIVNERNQVKLNPTSQNTTGKVNLELYTSDRNTLITNYSQNYSKLNPFTICLNSSLSGGEKYSLDGQVTYKADDYAAEYYHFQNSSISSSDLNQNITLYLLDNSTSTTFQITYKDENFIPLANALIQIQRKYVGEGVFKTVEIPKTDTNGKTIAHLEEEDVVYKFIVVKNGEILATFTDFLVKCADPVLGTCEININAFKSHIEPDSFINLDDFSFTIDYADDTRTISSVYTVPSSSAAVVSLNTTLYDGLGNSTVCSDTLTSASGTLTCVVPTAFGNSSVVVDIYKDGVIVGRKVFSVTDDPTDVYGANLAFLGFFLMISLIGISLGSSPFITGVFLLIGGIAGMVLNIFANTGLIGYGATALWLVIVVVILIVKATNRE